MVLEKADSVSSLAFLRSLQASRSYIAALVDDLKAHGLTEHPDPATPAIAAVLDQQLEDLFVPYFAGSSYIEREKRSLEELYSSLLFKFTTYHVSSHDYHYLILHRLTISQTRRRKMPTSYLGSLSARSRELISSARTSYLDRLDSGDIPSAQRSMLLRIAGLHSSAPADRAEIAVSDEDGALSLPYTKRMLKWLAEGVGRGLELANGHETPKDVRELLGLLIGSMGEVYLESAVDALIDTSTTQESSSKVEPDLAFLADLRSSISILHLLIATIQTLLVPLSSTNLTVRRDLEKQTSVFVDRMESKIDTVLQKSIDACLAWVQRLLSQQKKTDFRPKDDAQLQLDQLQTPTCLAIFNFMSKRVYSRAEISLSGKVLESFSLELAVGLRSALLVHFRSFIVSLTGGLIVSKDVAKYTELMRAWKVGAQFKESLEVLTEVANMYVIGPDALKERIRGIGVQGGTAVQGMEKADLRPFLLRREDANSVAMAAVLASF